MNAGIKFEALFSSDIYESVNIFYDKLRTVSEYMTKGFRSIPKAEGIYFVIRPKDFEVRFLETTTAILEFNGKCLLENKTDLKFRYECSNKIILYIGCSNNLHRRIYELINYSYGKFKTHRGGRTLWQIKDNEELLIGYFLTTEYSELKRELLNRYTSQFGCLPYANERDF